MTDEPEIRLALSGCRALLSVSTGASSPALVTVIISSVFDEALFAFVRSTPTAPMLSVIVSSNS